MKKSRVKDLFIDVINKSRGLFTSKGLVDTLLGDTNVKGSRRTASRVISDLLANNKVINAGNNQYLSASKFIKAGFIKLNYLPITEDYFIVIVKDIDRYLKKGDGYFVNEILSYKQIRSLFAYESMRGTAVDIMAEVIRVLTVADILEIDDKGVRFVNKAKWSEFFNLVLEYRAYVEENGSNYKLNPYRDKFISDIAFAIRRLSKGQTYSFKQIFEVAVLSLEQEDIDVQDFVESAVTGVIGAEVSLNYLERIGNIYRVK